MNTKVNKNTQKPKCRQRQRFEVEDQNIETQESNFITSELDQLIVAYAFFRLSGKAFVLPALLLALLGFIVGYVPLDVLATVVIVLLLWFFGAGATFYQLEKGGRK